MIFFGIATSSSGLAAYQDEYNNLRQEIVYPVLNAAFFIFLISVIEIIYRVWLRCSKRELSVKSLKRDMSVQEFAS
jgi:hypothetical protein